MICFQTRDELSIIVSYTVNSFRGETTQFHYISIPSLISHIYYILLFSLLLKSGILLTQDAAFDIPRVSVGSYPRP